MTASTTTATAMSARDPADYDDDALDRLADLLAERLAVRLSVRGGEPKPEPIDLQVLLTAPADFASTARSRVQRRSIAPGWQALQYASARHGSDPHPKIRLTPPDFFRGK
jgi:hypothetical protein